MKSLENWTPDSWNSPRERRHWITTRLTRMRSDLVSMIRHDSDVVGADFTAVAAEADVAIQRLLKMLGETADRRDSMDVEEAKNDQMIEEMRSEP